MTPRQNVACKRSLNPLIAMVILTHSLACVREVRAQSAADEIQITVQKSEVHEAAVGQNLESSTDAKVADSPAESSNAGGFFHRLAKAYANDWRGIGDPASDPQR